LSNGSPNSASAKPAGATRPASSAATPSRQLHSALDDDRNIRIPLMGRMCPQQTGMSPMGQSRPALLWVNERECPKAPHPCGCPLAEYLCQPASSASTSPRPYVPCTALVHQHPSPGDQKPVRAAWYIPIADGNRRNSYTLQPCKITRKITPVRLRGCRITL
jgi:hypothetical protein